MLASPTVNRDPSPLTSPVSLISTPESESPRSSSSTGVIALLTTSWASIPEKLR